MQDAQEATYRLSGISESEDYKDLRYFQLFTIADGFYERARHDVDGYGYYLFLEDFQFTDGMGYGRPCRGVGFSGLRKVGWGVRREDHIAFARG